MSEPLQPIEELAKQLTVSVSSVRVWLRSGYIPSETYIKVNNTYRFDVPKVIEALKQQPKTETETETVEEPTPQEKVPVQLELDFGNPDNDL